MATNKPVRFVDDETKPLLARAVALGLAVVRHCKAVTWADFEADLALLAEIDPAEQAAQGAEIDPRVKEVAKAHAALDLTQADWLLLARFAPVLNRLSVSPLVTVAVCGDCGEWVLVSSKTPSSCTMTAGCAGKPVKASIATKAKDSEPQVAESQEPPIDTEGSAVNAEADVTIEYATAAV